MIIVSMMTIAEVYSTVRATMDFYFIFILLYFTLFYFIVLWSVVNWFQ